MPKAVLAWFVKRWPCFASAAMLLLAFPPFNLGLLVLVGLVPWLLSLRESTGKEAWRSGYLFGFLFGLGQLFWVAQLTARWVGRIDLGIIPWLLACSLYAIYFGWTAVLIRHCWTRKWPWAIPLVWAGIEVFRSFIPMFAFPWGLIANPLWPYTILIQTAHFGTIYFVSAWVVLINVLGTMLFERVGYVRVRNYVSVAMAAVALSVVAYQTNVPSTPLTVTVAQPGVDMAFGTPEDQVAGLKKNVEAIIDRARHDGTQLLVLPEGVSEAPTMPPKAPFKIPTDLPILFGGQRGGGMTGTGPSYQSAFAFDGKRWQYVDKTRLVVFGEFIPFREYVPFIQQAFRLPGVDLIPGKQGVRSVKLAGITIGPIICFEALFPDVGYGQSLNDARLLAVIGIDDWFMDGNAPEQLRAASVWRAVETGLPLVRSTTLGHTLVCDPHGHIVAEVPLRTPTVIKMDVPIPTRSPAFLASPIFPAAFCLFAFAMPWLRFPRKKKEANP